MTRWQARSAAGEMGVEFPVSFNVAVGRCLRCWLAVPIHCLVVDDNPEFLETVRQLPDRQGTPSAHNPRHEAPRQESATCLVQIPADGEITA